MSTSTALDLEPLAIPLARDKYGVIRVGGTRVSLDSVIYDYLNGSTPDQVVSNFSVLSLADVFAVLAYFHAHRQAVERYLEEQEREGERIRDEWEKGWDREAFKRLLLERAVARKGHNGSTGE